MIGYGYHSNGYNKWLKILPFYYSYLHPSSDALAFWKSKNLFVTGRPLLLGRIRPFLSMVFASRLNRHNIELVARSADVELAKPTSHARPAINKCHSTPSNPVTAPGFLLPKLRRIPCQQALLP